MDFLRKMEKKFGRYAIRHLTMYIIVTYAAGYILEIMQSVTGANYIGYLSLNPYAILNGQVWRLVTWVLTPPGSFDIFTLIMLLFYYQIGTALEKVWGDFLYNVYIFFGLIMTVIGAFIIYALYGGIWFQAADMAGSGLISTYYVSLSLFLGFAMTFPDQVVLFMFIIPVKMKWLALLDVGYLIYAIISSSLKPLTIIIIVCSLANTIVMFLLTRKRFGGNRKRQKEFQKNMYGYNSGRGAQRTNSRTQSQTGRYNPNQGRSGFARHRCAVCGRTEISDPDLEFRFCSKCNGNYEYCSDHLYTHEHVK